VAGIGFGVEQLKAFVEESTNAYAQIWTVLTIAGTKLDGDAMDLEKLAMEHGLKLAGAPHDRDRVPGRAR
jgi:hypothetical protein